MSLSLLTLGLALIHLCSAQTALPASAPANCSVPDLPPSVFSEFPPQLQIAQIVQGDTIARQKYNSIVATNDPALKIAPKGTPDGTGDFSTVKYDNAADPDCWFTFSHCTKPKHSGVPNQDLATCGISSTYAISFDDGPQPFDGRLYDYLEKQKVTASMYYIGMNVLNFPSQARVAFSAGHVICPHTWSHHYLTSLTNEQVFAELYYGKLAVKRVLGISSRCFRPPYGDVDDRVRFIAHHLDLSIDLWDHDTDDWMANLPGANNTKHVYDLYTKFATLAPTPITALSHESTNNVITAFVDNFGPIKAAFRNTVSIHSCAGVSRPYFENVIFPTLDVTTEQGLPQNLPTPAYSPDPLDFTEPGSQQGSSSSSDSPTKSGSSTKTGSASVKVSPAIKSGSNPGGRVAANASSSLSSANPKSIVQASSLILVVLVMALMGMC